MTSLRCGLVLILMSLASCGDDASMSSADAGPVDAVPPPTWTNFASGFMETYCHACHGPGDALRDYSQLSMVRAEMDKIRCGVSPTALPGCTIPARQFPVGNGPKPSDDERNALVQWIDDGALE